MDPVLMDSGAGAVEAIAALERKSKDGEIIVEDGKTWLYAGGKLSPITWDPQPECLKVNTLTGLTRYIGEDPPFEHDSLLIVVDDVSAVTVYGPESAKTRGRPVICRATLDSNLKAFPFGQFMDQETFLISLYTQFDREAPDFAELVAYASKVVQDESVSMTDDGISQKAVVRAGLHSEESSEKAPAIVNLRPFRTFREIEQPTGLFVFRMRRQKDGVAFSLFEADGGAWRLEAMKAITEYLTTSLPNVVVA